MDQHRKLILFIFLIKSFSRADDSLLGNLLTNGADDSIFSGLLNDGGGPGGLPDAHRNPCQLIESRNFTCEQHFVVTDDGYILEVDRVVNPFLIANNKKTKGTIILCHGFTASATTWLINSEGGFAADWTDGVPANVNLTTEGRNLAYLLGNLGWDTWVINLRGCQYSRNSTKYNPNTDPAFWRFSFQQMGKFDAPNTIDFVLRKTNQKSLAWIGHSMGTLIMFALLATQPEYSAKVKPFIALAPVAYVGNSETPIAPLARVPGLKETLTIKGGEVNTPKAFLDLVGSGFCTLPGTPGLCATPFYILGGPSNHFNETRISVYIEAGFGGFSTWTLVHFAWHIDRGTFGLFDYGPLEDQQVYESTVPPQYNLSEINSRDMYLFSSPYDFLADQRDVQILKESFTVPYGEYIVKAEDFNHFDFTFGEDAYDQVYKEVVRILGQYI